MANITVSFSEMQQAAIELGSGREEITTRLVGLQKRMQGLVASGFVTDQASAKFETAYDDYTRGAKTVIQKIAEIESFLKQTATAMGEMDAQIAAKIGG
ncbi:WXG100 family type VII secretion target [Leucobacter soli]|uniref:ESAT-6-like protein n=1 Tax=Leucobacter soli TaxID=2812850 RepID=A0A916JVW7_9MICO|nr:WXG100 family type VII secretion target [Leucobacter soli]CAG7604288.1 hypothetical protein LEUCIP111803_00722 [Leucobacter soli]